MDKKQTHVHHKGKKKLKKTTVVLKSIFWFLIGGFLGLFLFASFVFIIFQKIYADSIYPGIMVDGVNFGGQNKEDVNKFFLSKNERISNTSIIFKGEDYSATTSASHLKLGYNNELLSKQAYSIGRSENTLSNITLVFQAYVNGINLSPSYTYSASELDQVLNPIAQNINLSPVDALFQFENGRVTAFRPSSEGKQLDTEKIKSDLSNKIPLLINKKPETILIPISVKIIQPSTTTDKANSLGIKELIATGTSLFEGSIPNRIHNVNLAASKFNGVLVAPGETFSFVKTLGDVSQFTGYKQAYVIENGKTILGDGGGVCQVSTTLFRAVLNAGLPVIERHPHAYRVHYYEEDSPPGIDATVFVPSVDFKFKNTTNNHILIQTVIDPNTLRLTFFLYGTKDGRTVNMSTPVITSQTPAPPVLYQDDPTLPKGVVKQIDFEAAGASVYFTRTVNQNGKVIISDKFVSNYRPWQAVFLRGTQ